MLSYAAILLRMVSSTQLSSCIILVYQDYHYFPYEKDSMVAAFLHLDAAGPDNGGLFVYPGSHKLGPQHDVGAIESNFHYVDQVCHHFYSPRINVYFCLIID